MNYIIFYCKIVLICLIFFVVCIAVTSCSINNKEKKSYKDFPVTVTLSQEKVNTPSNLYCVGGITLMDSVLVTVDIKADTILQVLKLPKYNNIGGFILRNEGPEGEVFVDPFIQHISGNKFLYRNMNSVKMVDYDTKSNKLNLLEDINLPVELMDLWHIFKLQDNIIGCKINDRTSKEFIGYNIKTKEIFDFGPEFPLLAEIIKPNDKNRIFAKTNIVKPDGSAFASAYDKFPLLRIYSNTGELVKEIWLDNNQSFPSVLIEKNPSESSINEIMQNYRVIKSSKDLIYALYIGKKEKDLKKGLNDFSNEIHVWSWKGDTIVRILLDKNIFSFDVDFDNKYIICASLESINGLYKYSIDSFDFRN